MPSARTGRTRPRNAGGYWRATGPGNPRQRWDRTRHPQTPRALSPLAARLQPLKGLDGARPRRNCPRGQRRPDAPAGSPPRVPVGKGPVASRRHRTRCEWPSVSDRLHYPVDCASTLAPCKRRGWLFPTTRFVRGGVCPARFGGERIRRNKWEPLPFVSKRFDREHDCNRQGIYAI